MYFHVVIVVVYVFSRCFCSKKFAKLGNNATKCMSFIFVLSFYYNNNVIHIYQNYDSIKNVMVGTNELVRQILLEKVSFWTLLEYTTAVMSFHCLP